MPLDPVTCPHGQLRENVSVRERDLSEDLIILLNLEHFHRFTVTQTILMFWH